MTPEAASRREGGYVALPLWVRVADGIAIAALGVALVVLVTGGFTIHLGWLRFSSHSVIRPLFVAAALAALRHAAAPAWPIHRRIAAWLGGARADPRVSWLAIAFGSRIAVLIVGYLAVLTIGVPRPIGFSLSPDPWTNLPARFDAGWYAGIAVNGYQFVGRYDRQQNIAFFPAYPMTMRVVAYAAGAFQPGVSDVRRTIRALWSGVVISILAFMWGALYIGRLARDRIGEARAPDALALLAAYPFALFYSAPYTEALFLLASAGAFFHFHRHEWGRAAAWAALTGFTRPNGCLLSVVLACLVLEHLWERRGARLRDYPFARAALAAAAPAAGMLAHSAYMRHLTGSWFGWTRVQVAWGRSFQGVDRITDSLQWIEQEGLLKAFAGAPFDTLNALGLIFAVAMVWPVFSRVGLAAGVFVVINIVPGLLTGGVLSMGRFTATLFPVFLALAAILPRALVVPVLIAFAVGQGLAAALFFTWRPLF